MLRECARVLEPGGRLAAVAIELVPGLSESERSRALELGPGQVEAPGTLEELAVEAGLTVRATESWVTELHRTLEATVRALASHEPALRADEGDEIFEEERGRKVSLLEGVEAGLLRRTLVVAERC